MRRVMRQSITHKTVSKSGEREVSHKRTFLIQAESPSIRHRPLLFTNSREGVFSETQQV